MSKQKSKEAKAEAIKTASNTSPEAKKEVIRLVKARFGVHAIYDQLVKKGFTK